MLSRWHALVALRVWAFIRGLVDRYATTTRRPGARNQRAGAFGASFSCGRTCCASRLCPRSRKRWIFPPDVLDSSGVTEGQINAAEVRLDHCHRDRICRMDITQQVRGTRARSSDGGQEVGEALLWVGMEGSQHLGVVFQKRFIRCSLRHIIPPVSADHPPPGEGGNSSLGGKWRA